MTRNQTKAEPFPASATESETETPGGGSASAPGVAGPSGGSGDAASVPSVGEQASGATSEELPVVQGVHVPHPDEPDPRS